ncbi:MAG: GTP-binding protein [Thermodesulfobacteriota bacterium]
MEERSLHIVIVGHVDHGKSTLIGRLFYDTESLPQEKIDEIRAISEEQGKEIEFAYIMDHLEEERKKGITIDTAQTFFKTAKRRYVIIDAPGHKEFLKNMITGSSQAEAALLLIDAEEGIREQTKRHCYILSMLGLKQVAVLVNKMDLVDYSKDRFDEIAGEIRSLLGSLSVSPSYIIPISASGGANVAKQSDSLKWFDGPTVLQALDNFTELAVEEKSLRFPVQDIYKINGKSIAVGRIEAGRMRKGEELIILPEEKKTHLLSIEKFQEEGIDLANTGECVGLCLDEPVARGQVLLPATDAAQYTITGNIHANIFWMTGETYHVGDTLTFKCASQEVNGRIGKIFKRFDPATVEVVEEGAVEIRSAEIAEVEINLERPVVVDSFTEIPEMGRFVLESEGNPVAGGIII